MALGLPSGLRADGKYWPERAYEAPPRIPAQRAVLAFREGLETLVIESSTESPSRSLGWIIPVPSEPLAAEEIRPGLFESLALILGPTVVHDLSRELRWAGWLFACMAICALLFALKVRLGWVLRFALGAAVLGGIVALALPVREVRLDRQRGPFFYPDVQGPHLSSILERAFRSDGPRDLDSARSRIAAAIAADWKKAWIEGVDGIERLHEADLLGPAPVELAAPWGYEVREEGGEIRVYLYGPAAYPELVWPAP